MKPWKLATVAGLAAFGLVVVVPFWWIANMSFKTYEQIQFAQSIYVPRPFTWENYTGLWLETRFPLWFRNSLITAVVVTGITTVIASLSGYAVARLRFPGRELVATLILVLYLVPPALLFIPLYRVLAELGTTNSLMALFLSYPTFTVPFCTWLLMGFFKSLPKEIEESAMVDGCSRVGAIGRIVLPLAVPGLLTVVIFALTLVIQEFVYSLTFISSVEKMTVSVGVPVALVRGDVYYWGSLMAACLITSVPIAIIYNFFLDRFIAGFTVGAIK
jgi:multiple sugar transport system permease protein